MDVKILGRRFSLDLDDNGLVMVKDEEITGHTVDSVIEQLRLKVKADKEKPRINILTFGNGWPDRETQYYFGTTTGEALNKRWTPYKNYWVAWTQDGNKRRAMLSGTHFWSDTPANRARLDDILMLRKSIRRLEEQIVEIEATLETTFGGVQ